MSDFDGLDAHTVDPDVLQSSALFTWEPRNWSPAAKSGYINDKRSPVSATTSSLQVADYTWRQNVIRSDGAGEPMFCSLPLGPVLRCARVGDNGKTGTSPLSPSPGGNWITSGNWGTTIG